MRGVELIRLPLHRDRRGSLLAIDEDQSLPFPIRRVFAIFGCTESAVRAEHAVSAHQALVAVQGCLTVDLENGCERQTMHLSDPRQTLHLQPGVWLRLRNFTADAVLLVASSECYSDVTYFDRPQPRLLWQTPERACA